MKSRNVPQDQDPSYEGATKLCYALDDDNHFVTVATNGWQVEATVKGLAWEAIHRDLENTRRQVQAGTASSLTYFMKLRLMDPTLLAQNIGISKFRLRWHLRPRVFPKLSAAWIAKYAACLEIPGDVLKTYRGELPYVA
jgi:hypothetical protein